MDWLIPLITLTLMEIVLGIDNIVFLAILVGKLPKEQQAKARQIGLGLALGARLLLLFTLSWILGMKAALFEWTDLGLPKDWFSDEANAVSFRDLVLLLGGLFLIGKATHEIHAKLEGDEEHAKAAGTGSTFATVLVQIAVIDIVFSLDSVITAVGMANDLWVMVVAMIMAVGVMLVFAGKISDFVHHHPTMKMLALSFLILIGVMLTADGLGQHIERGYIYFAMGFSLVVELLNLKMRKPSKAVELHEPQMPAEAAK